MLIRSGGAATGASLAVLVFALTGHSAQAQTIPGSLPSRAQVELPQAQAPLPQAQVNIEDRTQRTADCPFADSALEVNLTQLTFAGVNGTTLPSDVVRQLHGIVPPQGAHKLAMLCDLRDSAAAALRRAGYVAAVTIPPQEINGHEATLTIILGRLTDVHVNGNAGRWQRTLDARIAQLKALPALNTHEVERILLLANDVPGLRVNLVLKSAGTAPGELTGELAVSYTPWLLLANAQNSGSRTLGRESVTVRGEYYGLTGLSDRTFLGVSSTVDTDEQQVIQAGHYFGTDRGLNIGGRFSYAWSRPDFGALDLRSRSLIGGVDLYGTLARSVRTSATLGGGFELIEQRIQLNLAGVDGIPVTKDKLRIGYLRLSASTREPTYGGSDRWSIAGTLELRQGFDIFGATETSVITPSGYAPSRFEGDATATVIRGGADASVGIGRLFSLGGSFQGQWANHPLLSFEEFSVGNLTIGRGYDPGVTSGDRAIGGRVEPRVQFPIKSQDIGMQAFGFFDIAKIWNLDTFTTENGRTLRSFGGGARMSLFGRASLEATYAHPLDPELNLPGAKRASDRLLLSLTVQYAPHR